MISIIIPIFNQADRIGACLDSILAQTYRDLEVVIVDDGSSDDPAGVIDSFRSKFVDQQISLNITRQKNGGAPSARNAGYKLTRGEYLLFCDSDAVLSPTMLEKMASKLDTDQNLSFVYSSFYWGKKLFTLKPFDIDALREGPYIHTMSLLRRSIFPGWDESIKKFQDWDLWLTITSSGGTGEWIKEPLFTIKPGGTISRWLPSFAYRWLPFLPEVKKYNQAKKIIIEKHNL